MNKDQITYDDFQKLEIKVGEIKEVEKIEKSDKLLKLKVAFGDEERQIVSGISMYFEDEQSLVGKKVPFVTNLAPRMLMGHESQGMILAVNDNENFSLLNVNSEIKSGTDIS